MKWFDRWFESSARRVAQQTSRRSFLTKVGTLAVGGAALPLLPVARGEAAPRLTIPGDPEPSTPEGNPEACEYWRYCGFDGFMCACCGGTQTSCPPGSEASAVTWIGTCRNPADGKDYIVSYNDCCGNTSCGRCFCNRNEGDKPPYVPPKSNDINWCQGTKHNTYHCTVSVVVGQAVE